MVKIKQKKQLNLPQLIEHIAQNKYEAGVYQADNAPVYVRVGRIKGIHIEGSGTVFPHNTFTVTTEEEITEDTVFENLVEILDGTPNCLWERASVEDWKDEDSKEFHAYIDGEFKCIWRDGKLVE